MAEISTKVPLFPGDSEIDQLFQIYRILGTPNESIWPGISQLPQYKPIGPRWKKKDLRKELDDKLDVDGIDLLAKTLIFAPNKRITAKQMLCHKWFDEIREEMIKLFGNIYPHCGSKEYQLQKYQKENAFKQNAEEDITRNAEEWNKKHEQDNDDDNDVVVEGQYDDDEDEDIKAL